MKKRDFDSGGSGKSLADSVLAECVAAFAERDYSACAGKAIEALPNIKHFVLNQLLAICLQRLGQIESLPRLPQLMLDGADSQWEKSLIKLSFGQVDLESVLRTAQNNEQICQANYYDGARLLTLERPDAALERFDVCVRLDVSCLERRLAEIERDAMSSAPASDVLEQQFEMFNSRAQSLVMQGRYDDGIRVAEKACDLARRSWGQDSPRFAKGLITLLIGLAYADLTVEAMQLAQPAYSLAKKHFGEDHPDFANLLNCLAYLHKGAGNLDEAARMYEAAADIWEQTPGYEEEYAVAVNNLGRVYMSVGNHDKAEAYFRQAMDRLKRSDADDDRFYAGFVNNLALLYSEKGDLKSAERLHKEALEHRRKRFGENHPQFAESLNNLAHVYKEQRRFADAEPLFTRAAEVCEATQGIRHPNTLKALSALLEIFEEVGNREAAERLMAKIKSTVESIPEDRRYVLHQLPGLTEMFSIFKSAVEQAPTTGNLMTSAFAASGDDWASPSYQRILQQCADAFIEFNYGDCVRKAILLSAQDATHEVVQIFLMCISRMDAAESDTPLEQPRQATIDFMRSLVTDPWFRALIDLTLGLTSEGEVERLASDDKRRCQFLYYKGQRQMTEGRLEEALLTLSACAKSEVDCFERWMAERVRRASPHASDRSVGAKVARLNAQVTDLVIQGRYKPAMSRAEEAWALAEQLEEDASERLTSHYNLASLTYLTGNYTQAEALLENLLAVCHASQQCDRTLLAACLNTLGLIYTDTGRFDRAEPVLLEALEELRRAGKQGGPDYAQTQGNLAEVYREMGDVGAAIRVCQQALEAKRNTQGQDHPEYAKLLNNLGLLYLEIDDAEKAERLLEGAAQIRERVLPEDHPDIANSANALAQLYLHQGQHDKAETLLRRGLQITSRVYGQDHVRYASSLNNLAGVCFQAGRLDEAERLWQESLRLLNQNLGALHPYIATVTANIALVMAADGRFSQALALVKESEAAIAKLLSTVFGSSSERQRLIILRDQYLRLSVFLSIVAKMGSPSDEAANAFELVLRRKGIVGEAQSAQHDEILGGRYPNLRAKFDHLQTLREKIARKTLAGSGDEGPDAHRQLLADWDTEKERLESEIARAVPEIRLNERMRQLDLATVNALLPDGATLIEIVRFQMFDFDQIRLKESTRRSHNHYWAFVLCAGVQNNLQLVDLGEAERIDKMIAVYRNAVVGRGSARNLRPIDLTREADLELEAGSALRAAVFDPLRDVSGFSQRLLICPDGDFARLPWEVLPLESGRRLIDDYDISYLNVARDLLRLSMPPARERTPSLVISDPDFDLSVDEEAKGQTAKNVAGRRSRDLHREGVHFHRLTGTSEEGRQVATLLGVEPFTGRSATETVIKACRHPAILHIATHGFFLSDQELDEAWDPSLSGGAMSDEMKPFGRLSNANESLFLRSGLALAGANTWLNDRPLPPEAEDGILSAEDVMGLDLSGTELVTLSACETGLGVHHIGEGVLGLRRAFMLAGARTIVLSLWKVPDDQTRELMVEFYQRILAGEGRAAALKNAQLSMRDRHRDPYYWGAFICQGDPGPLNFNL